jgi:hypothetical protein
MTIEEQIESINRARAACRESIKDLEHHLGITHALGATLKLVGAIDALGAIRARKLENPARLRSAEEIAESMRIPGENKSQISVDNVPTQE